MKNPPNIICFIRLRFWIVFCIWNWWFVCFQQSKNPSKRSDCCSKTDVAHDPTHVAVSSCFGLILAPKIVVFSLKIDEQNVSKSHLLFFRDLFLQHAPKFDEKRPKMRCRTLGKWPWEHIGYFEAGCWSPRHPQKVFSCSLGPRLEAVWALFGSSPSLFRYHLKNILGYQTRRSQFAFRSWLLISCSSRHTLAIFVHPSGRGQGSPLTHPSWWPCNYNLHLPDSTTDVHIPTHIHTKSIVPKRLANETNE